MFDPKDPREEIVLTFDYAAAGADASNPITTASVTVRVVKGIDLTPNSILSGSSVLSDDGDKILQKVIGGVRGCHYEFSCLATIDGSKILIQKTLPVATHCGGC